MEKFLDLEYRGEGNRAIVFANPQTKQVYRLVKYTATRKIRKLLQESSDCDSDVDLKSIESAVKSELDSVVSYMNNLMKPLLSDRYVVSPTLTSLPKGFGEKAVALAGQARPGHRKNSKRDIIDPDVQCALVLPDCCFIRQPDSGHPIEKSDCDASAIKMDHTFDAISNHDRFSSDEVDRGRTNSPCCDKSQDNLNDSVDHIVTANCCNCKDSRGLNTCQSGDFIVQGQGLDMEDSSPRIGTIDWTCSRKDSGDYNFCAKNSECSEKVGCDMQERTNSQEEDTSCTLSIEIKPKKAFLAGSRCMDSAQDSQVCRFCMHQHLKRKSGQWPQTSRYCPLDLFSGNKQRMKHALFSLIDTPQNNLKICKNGKEIYGSEIRHDLCAILQDWFPANPNRKQKVVSLFLDLVIELLLDTGSYDNFSEVTVLESEPSDPSVQKCDNSSFIHHDNGKPPKLPSGCVLERIYLIQSLDELGIEGVLPLYKRLKEKMETDESLRDKWCLNGPYDDVSWLFGCPGQQLGDLDPDSDDSAVLKVKRFLVSKTLQDCSIIVAIRPVLDSTRNKTELKRFEGNFYEFSISIVDLDPKPFEKVKTYFRQATDIVLTFAEASGKICSPSQANSSS